MRTFTKPRSLTQVAARNAREQTALICRRAGITYDEWIALVFETGFQWAQLNYTDSMRIAMLEDPARGYWAWWVCAFIEDDKTLLDASVPVSAGRYETLKNDMIHAGVKN